jgi:hypothetical protein
MNGADVVFLGGIAGVVFGLVVALSTIIYNLTAARYYIKQVQKDFKQLEQNVKEQVQGAVQLSLKGVEVNIQQRRLAERNINVTASAKIYYQHAGIDSENHQNGGVTIDVGRPLDPFLVARVEIGNIGDGPVDLLACTVAGRDLSNRRVKGMAVQGRDVEWADLVPYFWNDFQLDQQAKGNNDPPPAPPGGLLFHGITTAKNITYAPDQLIRIDPRGHEELIRVDYLANLEELYRRGHLNLEYKIFTVVLGYPLAEINRQAGVSPSGEGNEAQLSRLYTLELARPNYSRWARVQRGLDTINRFPFRLAIEELEGRLGQPGRYYSHDPLGRLSEPAAFRCFLLHHWDFDELARGAPGDGPDPFGDKRRSNASEPTIDQVKTYIRENYDVYDPKANTEENLAKARAYCFDKLHALRDAWVQLNDLIDYVNRHDIGFARLISDPLADAPNGGSLDAQQRWNALVREGYLLTNVTGANLPMPQDPLALERYEIRSTYVLVTLKAPGHHAGRTTPEG